MGVFQNQCTYAGNFCKTVPVWCNGFILAHNHPGNSLVASEPDIRLTERVKEAATLMDIKLFDHIIVCKTDMCRLPKKD